MTCPILGKSESHDHVPSLDHPIHRLPGVSVLTRTYGEEVVVVEAVRDSWAYEAVAVMEVDEVVGEVEHEAVGEAVDGVGETVEMVKMVMPVGKHGEVEKVVVVVASIGREGCLLMNSV